MPCALCNEDYIICAACGHNEHCPVKEHREPTDACMRSWPDAPANEPANEPAPPQHLEGH